MNGSGESYRGVVPAKRSNEGLGGPQEIVEGRLLTKENARQGNPLRTPSRESGPSDLQRVRTAATRDGMLQPHPNASADANIRGRNRVR